MFFELPAELLRVPEFEYGYSIDALVERFTDNFLKTIGNPRTKWKIQSGANGTGRIASAILSFNVVTKETLVLGAIETDIAPKHEHTYGETIFTLAGVGDDIDEGKIVKPRRGCITVHKRHSIHAPGCETFWAYLYHQPEGMRIL